MVEKHGRSTLSRAVVIRHSLALVPGLLLFIFFTMRTSVETPEGRHFTLFDDAMISMTYARTLARTGEWVWFPDAERVQGFTNPLWTLYMAAVHKVGLEGSQACLAIILTGIVVLVCCSLLVSKITFRALSGWKWSSYASAAAGGSVLLLYPLVYWTLRGMEVGVLALFLLTMIANLGSALRAWQDGKQQYRALWLCGAAGALGCATRMDFVVIAAMVTTLIATWAPCRRSRWHVLGAVAAPWALTCIASLVFQQAYWGDWLPNTYRLKVEGVELQERLARGLVSSGKILPVLILTLGGLLLTRLSAASPTTKRCAFALFATVFAATAYSIWVGGDAWENFGFINRYASAVLPASVALVAIGTGLLLRDPLGASRGLPVASLGLLSLTGTAAGAQTNPFGFSNLLAFMGAISLLLPQPLILLSSKDARRNPDSPLFVSILISSAASLLVLGTGALPLAALVAGYKPPGIEIERPWILDGIKLGEVTQSQARIALTPAGDLAYYANRPVIDLLGKSDRRIAHEAPRSVLDGKALTFKPGHNKWNNQYSIGELKPDIVYDFYAEDMSEMRRNLQEWGYRTLCLPSGTEIFVLSTSTLVDGTGFSTCGSH